MITDARTAMRGLRYEIGTYGDRNGHPVNRVLYLGGGGIGDAIMRTPTLQALRERFAGAELHVANNGRGFELIPEDIADKTLLIGRDDLDEYDLAIVGKRRGANSYGGLFGVASSVSRSVIDYHFPDSESTRYHEVLRCLSPVVHLGYDGEIPKMRASTQELDDEEELREGNFIGIHTGCHSELLGAQKGHLRKWGIEKWETLIRTLSETGRNVLLIGGPDEKEDIAYLTGRTRARDYSGFSLQQSARVIELCDSFVSLVSAPIHIAAAVGTPIVALNGPTIAEKSRPWTDDNKYAIVDSGLPCSPCYMTPAFFACDDNRCMQELGVDSVLHVLDSFDGETNGFSLQSNRG
ncbi:glycosyltransferase family 9 protein [Candidatus Aenigmatarchaeota archaeon]